MLELHIFDRSIPLQPTYLTWKTGGLEDITIFKLAGKMNDFPMF